MEKKEKEKFKHHSLLDKNISYKANGLQMDQTKYLEISKFRKAKLEV